MLVLCYLIILKPLRIFHLPYTIVCKRFITLLLYLELVADILSYTIHHPKLQAYSTGKTYQVGKLSYLKRYRPKHTTGVKLR